MRDCGGNDVGESVMSRWTLACPRGGIRGCGGDDVGEVRHVRGGVRSPRLC